MWPELASDLASLHDRCEPFSESEAHAILAEELGEDVLRTHFDPPAFWEAAPPVAVASLGQVYRARLTNPIAVAGQPPITEVAVKVRCSDRSTDRSCCPLVQACAWASFVHRLNT